MSTRETSGTTGALGASNTQTMMDVRPGAHRYVRFNGAAKKVGEYVAQDYRKPVVITGERSWEAFEKAGGTVGSDVPVLRYDGSVTFRNMDELTEKVLDEEADVIVAVGGGRLCDTAKGVHHNTNLPLITVPTIAATCAASSSVIIVYDENGKRIAGIPLRHGAELVIADPLIIAAAPERYLVGGIGDTLAKWYEAEGIQRHLTNPEPADTLGLTAAKVTRDYLVREGDEAIESVRRGVSDEVLGHMVDVIVHVASCVGGFAGKNGRVSGAHAVHNGLTACPETQVSTHGQKVAYGILVQLAAQSEWAEFDRLVPTYRKIGLPCTFAEVGAEPTPQNLAKVAEVAGGPESFFRQAVPDIDEARVVDCIKRVDARAAAIDEKLAEISNGVPLESEPADTATDVTAGLAQGLAQ